MPKYHAAKNYSQANIALLLQGLKYFRTIGMHLNRNNAPRKSDWEGLDKVHKSLHSSAISGNALGCERILTQNGFIREHVERERAGAAFDSGWIPLTGTCLIRSNCKSGLANKVGIPIPRWNSFLAIRNNTYGITRILLLILSIFLMDIKVICGMI